MRIIDNKKDYYDYLAGVLGIDDYITYDRRNSKRLVNKTTNSISERCPMGYGHIFCTWKNGKDPNSDSVYDTGYDWDKGHKTVGKIYRKLGLGYQPSKSNEFPDAYNVSSNWFGLVIGSVAYVFLVYRILQNETDTEVKIVPKLMRKFTFLTSHGIRYRRELAYKQPYNIWRKINTQKVDFEHLECRHFTRIVFPEDVYVSEKNMCLNIYSLLTDNFKERPNSIINYVDQPKQNGYQSFHTQLLSDYGVWEEIHIQSERMTKKSHLGYMLENGRRDKVIYEWLETFRGVLKDVARNTEEGGSFFIESVRASFYNDDIRVYTPDGKSMKLPKNSSAIDFAFGVHTEVGLHAKYAKINGHLASVKTTLKRGDCVEIGTDPNVWPQEDWVAKAKSYKALRNLHIYLAKKPKPQYLRCPLCNPIPGEEVIGFRNADNSITVHRRDCADAIGLASQFGDSIVPVEYIEQPDVLYSASLTAKAVDRQHLLSDIIDSISNRLQLSINELHTVTEDEIVTCTINFMVHSYKELQTIVQSILDIPDVDEVSYKNE